MPKPKLPDHHIEDLILQGLSLKTIAHTLQRSYSWTRSLIANLYAAYDIPTDNPVYDPRFLLTQKITEHRGHPTGSPGGQASTTALPNFPRPEDC